MVATKAIHPKHPANKRPNEFSLGLGWFEKMRPKRIPFDERSVLFCLPQFLTLVQAILHRKDIIGTD